MFYFFLKVYHVCFVFAFRKYFSFTWAENVCELVNPYWPWWRRGSGWKEPAACDEPIHCWWMRSARCRCAPDCPSCRSSTTPSHYLLTDEVNWAPRETFAVPAQTRSPLPVAKRMREMVFLRGRHADGVPFFVWALLRPFLAASYPQETISVLRDECDDDVSWPKPKSPSSSAGIRPDCPDQNYAVKLQLILLKFKF